MSDFHAYLAIGGGIFGHFCQNGILSHLGKRDNGLFMGKLRFFARLARPLHIECYAFGPKPMLKLGLFRIITVFYVIFLEI